MKQSAYRSIGFGNDMSSPSQTSKTTGIWPLLLDACIEDPLLGREFPDVTFNAEMVDLLLAKGANPYFRAPDAEHTVLETIAMANSIREVKILLERTQLGEIIKVKDQESMLNIAANNRRTRRSRGVKDFLKKTLDNKFWPTGLLSQEQPLKRRYNDSILMATA